MLKSKKTTPLSRTRIAPLCAIFCDKCGKIEKPRRFHGKAQHLDEKQFGYGFVK